MAKPLLHRWAIYLADKLIGTVKATDEQSAIKAAIEKLGVTDPQQQECLLTRQIGIVVRGTAVPKVSKPKADATDG